MPCTSMPAEEKDGRGQHGSRRGNRWWSVYGMGLSAISGEIDRHLKNSKCMKQYLH